MVLLDMMRNEMKMFELNHDAIHEDSPHRFSGFASDLRFPVGTLPKKLNTDMGNGLPFVLSKVDGEIFLYHQAAGALVLTVFND